MSGARGSRRSTPVASSKREKELARMRAERQAARRAAAAARRRQRNLIITSVVGVALIALGAILLAGKLGGGSTNAIQKPKDKSPSASPTKALPPGTCKYTKSTTPAARKVELPPVTGVETKQAFVAHLRTNLGLIDVTLDSAAAPCTANNFRSLAHFKYFDNTPCHRLTTQGIFVLQCGDPTGKGTGGPGYTVPDENHQGAQDPQGTVAQAHSRPGTHGRQVFLVDKHTQPAPNNTAVRATTHGPA